MSWVTSLGASLGLLLASVLVAGQAGAAAGHVDFATTGTTVSGADGRQRPLAKGADLNSGDTIRTDAAGRAQIRFPDGAYVSLQPNTEFAIKEYNFDGKADGSERGFFGLARGAMRAVTGLIGRVNKNRYQISTPTATIGIRGTGGLISIGPDGSTLVNGTSGIWTISNAAGTIDVPAGVSGKAPTAPNQPPAQTTEKPSAGPVPVPVVVTTLPIQQADQRDTQGISCQTSPTAAGCGTGATPPPANPNPPLVSGSNFGIATHTDDTCDGDCGPQGFSIAKAASPVPAVFDSSGRLTQFTMTNSASENVTYTLDVANGGTHAEFGTRDGVIAWGRWVGPVIVDTFQITNTFASDQGLHYVVGVPTPIATFPTGSGTLTFNLLGATSPTYTTGGVAPGTVTSATLTANFATGAVGLSLNAQDGNGLSYNGTSMGTMNRGVPGAVFTTSGGGSGTGCPNGCGFTGNGFFAGDAATHAGVSYNFTNTAGPGDLIGAAALKR